MWATGWEEKANEYLPLLLDLPDDELPVLTFDGRAVFGTAHWKLGAIDEYAGDRAAAWIDDSLDERCTTWADERPAPTLWSRPIRPPASPTSTSSGCSTGHWRFSASRAKLAQA